MKIIEEIIRTGYPGEPEEGAVLKGFVLENYAEIDLQRKRPAVIVFPGGGYEFTSKREEEIIALEFMAAGITAFYVNYSVAPVRFPQQLLQGLCCVQYVRSHADEFHIDPDNIAVCGFSAGGHLAASVGLHWNTPCVQQWLGNPGDGVKSNKMILSYPVITSGVFAHRGSFNALLGDKKDDPELLEFNSLEKQVTSDAPEAFIWHTYEDDLVPVQNAMMLANAYIEQGIHVELHVYKYGGHGKSLGNFVACRELEYGGDHPVSDWIDRAIRFMHT